MRSSRDRAGGAGSFTRPLAVSTSSPFNRPSGYLVIRPPVGSAVRSSISQRRSAIVFTTYSWPPRTSTTGLTGATRVEVVAQRQAPLAQLAFVPVAVGDDDFAGLGRLHPRRDGGGDIGERPGARQVHAGTAAGAVQVVVHQAGNDRPPAEIDEPRARAGQRPHPRRRAGGDDAIAGDGHAPPLSCSRRPRCGCGR